jgi:hypothetical protein
MKKLLVMMLMAMSLAAVVPAIGASPAFAVQARCTVGTTGSPIWWANKNALEVTGHTRVMAVRLPAGVGTDTILWELTGEENQKWKHECIGYDSATGRNNWKLHYAPNPSLCLANGNFGFVGLSSCSGGGPEETWQRVERGSFSGLREPSGNICLQPRGGGTGNGVGIIWEVCTYSAAQLWY